MTKLYFRQFYITRKLVLQGSFFIKDPDPDPVFSRIRNTALESIDSVVSPVMFACYLIVSWVAGLQDEMLPRGDASLVIKPL